MGHSIERAERVYLNTFLAHSQASILGWACTVSDGELVLSKRNMTIDQRLKVVPAGNIGKVSPESRQPGKVSPC